MSAPTSPCAPFVAELEQEAVATRKLLERLPADKLAWRPHPKSQSLGQLALHVATTPAIVSGMIANDRFDLGAVDFTPKQPSSVREVRDAFESALSGAKTTLATWGANELAKVWRVQKGSQELMAMPKAAALRNLVLNHHVHHRGQLTVYLRLLDVPLPSVYGPSADDNPFATPPR
jgi:uncharacterized damage-inducible protein DinB